MQTSFRLKLLFLSLIFLPFSPARAQGQSAVANAPNQEKAEPSVELKKSPEFITSDTPSELERCKAITQGPGAADKQDPVLRAFLHTIAGRWNFAYVRRGNQVWWPDHTSSRPKNEIHYLFAPHALLFESRPEFALPSVTGCFVYGSGHKVSAELFDLELRKPSDLTATQTVRFKLSANHKTLQMALDAETNPEPTIQVLEFRDSNWSPPPSPDRSQGDKAAEPSNQSQRLAQAIQVLLALPISPVFHSSFESAAPVTPSNRKTSCLRVTNLPFIRITK